MQDKSHMGVVVHVKSRIQIRLLYFLSLISQAIELGWKYRPKPVFNQERCKGCRLCTSVCPKEIIVQEIHFNAGGYHPAAVSDVEKCVGCAACAKICPEVIIEIHKEER